MLNVPGPLCVRASALTGRSSAVHGQLRRAVGFATKSPRQACSFCPNPDDVLSSRLLVRVLPLDEQASLAAAAGGPFALLFIARGTNPMRQDELIQLFGLTPSEPELVRLLGQGLSPTICADRRHVGIATVRTQLSSIYAKTGVSSLPQLLSLVLTLPGLA